MKYIKIVRVECTHRPFFMPICFVPFFTLHPPHQFTPLLNVCFLIFLILYRFGWLCSLTLPTMYETWRKQNKTDKQCSNWEPPLIHTGNCQLPCSCHSVEGDIGWCVYLHLFVFFLN